MPYMSAPSDDAPSGDAPSGDLGGLSATGERSVQLYVDRWDFRLTRSALVVHIPTKQPNHFLALHELMTGRHRASMHCSRPLTLECTPYCATRAWFRRRRYRPRGRPPRVERCEGVVTLPKAASVAGRGADEIDAEGNGGIPTALLQNGTGEVDAALHDRNSRSRVIADAWCTLHARAQRTPTSAGRASRAAKMAATELTCCGDAVGSNASSSCTAPFGSNKWAVVYRQAAALVLGNRFESVEATRKRARAHEVLPRAQVELAQHVTAYLAGTQV